MHERMRRALAKCKVQFLTANAFVHLGVGKGFVRLKM